MDIDARRERLRTHADDLVSEFGSPLYAFFEDDLRANYETLRTALDDHYPDSVVHFAVKANYNLGVLSVLRTAGCKAEAYARCELTATQRAGFDANHVLLTGMNRAPEDIERALEWGVSHLLVDNVAELEKVIVAANATDTSPDVLIRGNPAMEVPTHPEVATATRESKFGLDIESGRAMAVAETAVESDAVSLAGVQLHVGSQIRGVEPYGVAAREMLGFAGRIRDELGVECEVLDLGGGFPVPYDEDVPATEDIVKRMAKAVRETCADLDLPEPRLFVEPGRRLVGNAGTFLGSVGVIK
ncbi:diaminopimelate decarboxylase family protein [Haladaptatus sp. DFWS20]|uniref:diaminopimelate decarboxylase family protein n=1 Tax=Haladaptatus sp. DFWS20 TaxID=3403467 RepID=UPI003EB7CF4E